ncbi:hypothetical protein ACLOJK_023960 [Asimina triloba]
MGRTNLSTIAGDERPADGSLAHRLLKLDEMPPPRSALDALIGADGGSLLGSAHQTLFVVAGFSVYCHIREEDGK